MRCYLRDSTAQNSRFYTQQIQHRRKSIGTKWRTLIVAIIEQQSSDYFRVIELPSWSSEVITPRSEVWWEVVLVHVKPRIKAANTKFIKLPLTHSSPAPRSAAKAESTLSMMANHINPVQAIHEIQYCSCKFRSKMWLLSTVALKTDKVYLWLRSSWQEELSRHRKLSPFVGAYDAKLFHLLRGYRWNQESPFHRSFAPMLPILNALLDSLP